MQNYVKIKTHSLLYNTYAYFDSRTYLIDAVLNNAAYLPVYFLDTEYVKPDCPDYVICFLKCFKWDSKKLETEIFPVLDMVMKKEYGEDYQKDNPLAGISEL